MCCNKFNGTKPSFLKTKIVPSRQFCGILGFCFEHNRVRILRQMEKTNKNMTECGMDEY